MYAHLIGLKFTLPYNYAYAITHICPSISPSMPSVTMGIRPYAHCHLSLGGGALFSYNRTRVIVLLRYSDHRGGSRPRRPQGRLKSTQRETLLKESHAAHRCAGRAGWLRAGTEYHKQLREITFATATEPRQSPAIRALTKVPSFRRCARTQSPQRAPLSQQRRYTRSCSSARQW